MATSTEDTHVVANFLLRRDRGFDEILLVRRSQRVGSYQGALAGISGFVEPGVSPLEQAYTEIREETSLTEEDVKLLRAGQAVRVDDASLGRHWVVHPFLFEVLAPDDIQTDWEAAAIQWIAPASITQLATVPKLAEALDTVYPPDHAAP
jgi:8-oxo-dGTP diphosphatase